MDNVSNMQGSEEDIILERANNITLEWALKFNFRGASNNQVASEALIASLKLEKEVGARKLRCYGDLQLVQGQVANRYQAKEAVLLRYYHALKTLVNDFDCFEMYHIPMESNTMAYLLSKLASTKKTGHLKTIIQDALQAPTRETKEVMVEKVEELD